MLSRTLLLASTFLVLALPATGGAQEGRPADARDLARTARAAAFRYESLQRRLAPSTWDSGRRGDLCDERIGRFCFWYDSPSEPPPPPPPEPEPVADARTVAVRAHRQWFATEPSHPRAAGFLIRYLIESDRAREAVAAARTHAWAAERSAGSLLLVGLALHYAGDFAAAEAVFDSARTASGPEERERLDDLTVLLEPRERGRYARLSEEERTRYHDRFWALADPSLLEPGNERRSGHYARHGWVRIFSEAPRVRGAISWGRDHEEILLRYGLPASRKRIRDSHPMLLSADPRFIESFEPGVSLVPPALLTRGLPEAPPPGVRHEIERDTAPSVYTPIRLRLRPLDATVHVFPAGSAAVLQIEAVLSPDTVAPTTPRAPRGLVAVLDTTGREVARSPARVEVRSDSTTRLAGSLAVPPGSYVYRVEVLDDSTGLAGLTQYRLEIPEERGLAMSDLVVALPFGDSLPRSRDDPRLRPHASLVLPPGARVGLYAEVRGLVAQGGESRYEVDWVVEPLEEGSLLGRAARWLGEALGLVRPESPPRIRWEDAAAGGPAPLAVNMDLSDAGPGLYRIVLTVTDRATGLGRTTERLIRISDAPDPAQPRARD